MAFNSFARRLALLGIVGGVIVGYFNCSLNGSIEMDGFKSTFSELYSSDQLSGSPGNSTSLDGQVCSSGNGADSDMLIGFITSSGSIMAVIGGLSAGWLADYLSRKHTLLIGGLSAMIGGALSAVSFHTLTLIIGRGFGGFSMGMIYMVMPVYISETTPKESRGLLSGLLGAAYAFGLFLSACFNFGFSELYYGWRLAFGTQVIIGLLFIIIILWMPYSPRWLVKKQREKEALLVLSKINHDSQKETFVVTALELEELKCSIKGTLKMSTQFRELLKYKYRLLIVIVLFFVEAVVGNSIYNYSSTIFCNVGTAPFVASMIVAIMTSIGSFAASHILDKIGRKAILLGCTFINIFLGASVAVLLQAFESPSEVVSYIIAINICFYTLFYTSGWLVVPWVLNGEIFPTDIRGITVAVSTAIFYFFTVLFNQAMPLILGSLQVQGFFYIITGVNGFAFFFVLFILPETKGVGLEQMDALFSQGLMERANLIKLFRSRSVSSQTKDLESQCKVFYQIDTAIDKKNSNKAFVDHNSRSL